MSRLVDAELPPHGCVEAFVEGLTLTLESSMQDNSVRQHFAKQLVKRRVAMPGQTRSSFAASLGLDESVYARYELGHSEPNFTTLLHICHHLGCSPNDLLIQKC
jgi:transcriptional regulator with XRE-family HTH domain